MKAFPLICENTFEHFMNTEETLIPEFPYILSDLVTVERNLGGGKSGAFLFLVKFRKFKWRGTKPNYVLKLYANAYNSINHVQDTRPFREIYTQCAMSGTAGYNCLLGFAKAPWELVSDLFGLTTYSLYESNLQRNKLADGRVLNPVPTQVLFMICTFTSGTPLLDLNLHTHGHLMPGITLNLFSTLQKAERRLGNFTHWDLHADNIFVDTKCEKRPPLPLAFFGKLSFNHIWEKVERLTADKAELEEFRLDWNNMLERMNLIKDHFRQTQVMTFLFQWLTERPYYVYKGNLVFDAAIDQAKKEFDVYMNRKLAYAHVTLIDFDLANSDQFASVDPIHKAKLASVLPMAERTLSWLLKWIPATQVFRITEMLLLLRKTVKLPANQSDLFHCIIYVIVALVYWDSPIDGVKKITLDDMITLHQRADSAVTELQNVLNKFKTLSMDSLQSFFMLSVQRLLPASCRPPRYCGVLPVMAMNYFQLSASVMKFFEECTDESDGILCKLSDVLNADTTTVGVRKEEFSQLLKSIHGNLLILNIRHFLKTGKFVTLDDLQFTMYHKSSQQSLMVDVELPWEEITENWKIATRTVINNYTTGRCNVLLKCAGESSKLKIKIKNGTDVHLELNTELDIVVYNIQEIGKAYNVRVETDTADVERKDTPLFVIKLNYLKIKKSGSLVELAATFDYQINSRMKIKFVIMFVQWFLLPGNLTLTQDGSRINIIMSFPPSDKPIHQCVGLATDPTNLEYALNCMGDLYGPPTIFSKLKQNMTGDTAPILRMFLNTIMGGIELQNPETIPEGSFLPVWNISWVEDMQLRKNTQLLFPDLPDSELYSLITAYLQKYQPYNNLPELPVNIQALFEKLPVTPAWEVAPRNTFQLDYIKYLATFVTDEDSAFFDATEA